jgi:hypothetical protein
MSAYPSRTQSNRPRREKIIVGFDPLVVRLDSPPEGLQTQSNFGNGIEYQYFVNEGSGTTYLPAAGRDAIIASGAQAGDEIEICKSQRGRLQTYVCTVLRDSQEPPPPPAPASAPPRPLAVVPPQQGQGKPELRATAISTCLRVAIDDMVEAREYASAKKLELDTPTWEDVRAIAISYFIQRSKA